MDDRQQADHRDLGGAAARRRSSTWNKDYTWATAKYTFATNGDKHWLTSWRTWTGDRRNWYRIGFRARAWHNSTLLSSEVVYSRKC